MKPSTAKSVQVQPDDSYIDPELYDRVFARSAEFLEARDSRVWSTELPDNS